MISNKINLTMKEAMTHCHGVGCVYPNNGQSYYIGTNLGNKGEFIVCLDGMFWCVRADHSKLPKCYKFESFTLSRLKDKETVQRKITELESKEYLDSLESEELEELRNAIRRS